jgi:outer membrane immunogenic protein
MRRFLLAAVMFGAACGAQAADMPDFLRGSLAAPAPARNWDGWYAGGQVDYMSAQADFSRSVVGLTNFIFRDSVLQGPASQFGLLPKTTMQGTGFGAFVGRNWQWEDLVFGLEANYNYLNRLATSTTGSNALAFTNPSGEIPPPNQTFTYGLA